MRSESKRPVTIRAAHPDRLGVGYRLSAPGLYLWEERLAEVLVAGAELGALPARHAWRRDRQPAPVPARRGEASPGRSRA